jgi:hypothetical protein
MNEDEPQPQTVQVDLIVNTPVVLEPSVHVVPIARLPKVQPHHIRQVAIVVPTRDSTGYLMELRDHDGSPIHDSVGSAQSMDEVLAWIADTFRDLLE